MPLNPPQNFRKTAGEHRLGVAADRPNAADVLIGTLYFSMDTLVLERSNGTTWDSYSPSGGTPGATGAIGPPGLQGEQGEPGDIFIVPGPTGAAGAAGAAGSQGISGPIGLDGLQGEQGEIGFPGPTGPAGSSGATGIQGIQGPPGPPGLDSEEPEEPLMVPGPRGPTGPTSLNILRVTTPQTINAGVATYTNVTELTFPVVNGVSYAFYFYIVFQSVNTTTGWKASVNCPTGTLDFHQLAQVIADSAAGVATWTERHSVTRDDMTLLTTTITAASDLINIIQGRYLCTANGTFAIRFANELANNDITIRIGSWGFYF
ncbi:MAG: hypothetical protein ABWY25_10140 [Paenisporosarcina sp.]